KEIKDYLRGAYGKTPVPVDEAFRRSIIGDETVITTRPADLIAAEFDQLKKELGPLAKTDEDVLTYALFPEVGKSFLEKKYQPPQDEQDSKIRIKAVL